MSATAIYGRQSRNMDLSPVLELGVGEVGAHDGADARGLVACTESPSCCRRVYFLSDQRALEAALNLSIADTLSCVLFCVCAASTVSRPLLRFAFMAAA